MSTSFGLICIFAIVWSWLGYPCFMWLVTRFTRQVYRGLDAPVDLCVIVVVHNEAKLIRQKLDNLLSLEWPSATRELIVVSDFSSDETEAIVGEYVDSGVQLVVSPSRIGKDRCQRLGILASHADIIAFTDAAGSLDPGSLRAIAQRFGDDTVACVSGVDVPHSAFGRDDGENLYVRYEMQIRRWESMLGAVVGVIGCLFAARRALCRNWRDDLSSDFALPLAARHSGFSVVVEENAVCRYQILSNSKAEFDRKVRTIVHGMNVVRAFFGPVTRSGKVFLAFQLLSRKVLRWSSPLLVAGALLTGVLHFQQSAFWLAVTTSLTAIAVMAVLAFSFPALRERRLLRGALYFALVNVSMIIAFGELARGREKRIWEPTRR